MCNELSIDDKIKLLKQNRISKKQQLKEVALQNKIIVDELYDSYGVVILNRIIDRLGDYSIEGCADFNRIYDNELGRIFSYDHSNEIQELFQERIIQELEERKLYIYKYSNEQLMITWKIHIAIFDSKQFLVLVTLLTIIFPFIIAVTLFRLIN